MDYLVNLVLPEVLLNGFQADTAGMLGKAVFPGAITHRRWLLLDLMVPAIQTRFKQHGAPPRSRIAQSAMRVGSKCNGKKICLIHASVFADLVFIHRNYLGPITQRLHDETGSTSFSLSSTETACWMMSMATTNRALPVRLHTRIPSQPYRGPFTTLTCIPVLRYG